MYYVTNYTNENRKHRYNRLLFFFFYLKFVHATATNILVSKASFSDVRGAPRILKHFINCTTSCDVKKMKFVLVKDTSTINNQPTTTTSQKRGDQIKENNKKAKREKRRRRRRRGRGQTK